MARCALRRCDIEAPVDHESWYCPDAGRDFLEHGMIFARESDNAVRVAQPIEKTAV